MSILLIFFVYSFFISSFHQCFHTNCSTFKKWINNTNQTILLKSSTDNSKVTVKSFLRNLNSQLVYGRAVLIDNLFGALKVIQADNDDKGCDKHVTALPSRTGSMVENCELVVNAGLFNTTSGACYGNVINDGRVFINFGGIRNAHFGIKKDRNLFFGYLSEEEVLSGDFDILVGGAIWLVRNGKSVVDQSVREECADVQETGSLDRFASVLSARSAIGAFSNGTVVVVQVGGRTDQGGVNLMELAVLMAEMGVAAAVNLDGGGSSTLVVNGTVVSLPSDRCGPLFTCERRVTTVLCLQRPLPHHGGVQRLTVAMVVALLCLAMAVLLGCVVGTVVVLRCRQRPRGTTMMRTVGDGHGKDGVPLMEEEEEGEGEEEL